LSNYLQSFFNKPIEQISLVDVVQFFSTEQEETASLEFKTGEIEIIDLYKEIAAFLNTEGGLIIIGSPREQKKYSGKIAKRICIGDITYSNFNSKDWLFQKIQSNITPSPLGVIIKQFSTEKGCVFLIEVPQSDSPPPNLARE
jgi:predicted HTH transcriptional regulator